MILHLEEEKEIFIKKYVSLRIRKVSFYIVMNAMI